jgi:hypothetical protein
MMMLSGYRFGTFLNPVYWDVVGFLQLVIVVAGGAL